MSVADKIRSLIQIKAQLQTAIKAKGVAVENNTPFSEYPGKISAIDAVNPDSGGFTHTINAAGSMQISKFIVPKNVTRIVANDVPPSTEELILPEGLNSVGGSAFSNLSRLKKVVMPSTWKQIPAGSNGIFLYCAALQEIDLQYIESINSQSVFAATGLKMVDLRKLTSSSLPNSTFSGCSSLHTVLLPPSIKTLEASCFNGCIALENIDLKPMVSIGDSALRNTPFRKLDLPNCTSFSLRALFDLPNLEEVVFSNNLVILPTIFNENNKLKSLIFPKNFTVFQSTTSPVINGEAKYLKYVELGETLASVFGNFIATSTPVLEVVKINKVVPPTANSSSPPFSIPANMQSIFKIYVPDQSVNAYKNATAWSNVAQYIRPMSEFVMPVL